MSSKYKLYFTFNNEKEKLRIPVLPEQFDVTKGSNIESINIADLGELLIIQDMPADQISFSSYFPGDGGTNPSDYISMIDSWRLKKKPIHVILTGASIDVNTYMAIISFSYYEQGGDVGTIYYSITLKEFREPTVRKITVGSDGSGKIESMSIRTDNRKSESSYTVKAGDFLIKIAKSQLKDSGRWKEIAQLNKIAAPYTIYPGQILKLPEG